MSETTVRQNENVAWRMIEGEGFLISPEDSRLYRLNGVATRIWELCENEISVGAIAETLCREFDVDRGTALGDAGRMVEAFVQKRLLVASERRG
jgi:hypothetical protein